MPSRRSLALLVGALVAVVLASACSALTGAGDYSAVSTCTGTACAVSCESQGGMWNAASSTCTCASEAPLCGGTCCASTAPYCVSDSQGGERCSACTAAAFECGAVCCEGQTCLNATVGACGSPYGRSGQSCTGGLACPIPLADGGVEDASCCASIPLPGGKFEMGRSVNGNNACPEAYASLDPTYACNDDEVPAHAVTIAPYALDRFEVTVSRFRKFVDAWDYQGLPEGAGGDAVVAGAGWHSAWNVALPTSRADLVRDVSCLTDNFDVTATQTWTSEPGYRETVPINCVTWYEAFAFCVWDGGRLPTEAEWEYAAANGVHADLYPWGEATPSYTTTVYECTQDPINPCLVSPTSPFDVGSRFIDENEWGHRDLAGNVSEWVLDSTWEYPSTPLVNPANVASGFRVSRGGDFASAPVFLRAQFRGAQRPSSPATAIGLRCARGT